MSVKDLAVRLLPKGRFVRGVLALSTATAIGQAIAILTSPVITRLYSPEDFGVLAVYSSYLGIIIVIASLRYELAIPLPRSDGSAANVLALSLVNLAGVTALTGLVVALFGKRIVVWSNTPQLISYIWLLPLGVLLGGAYQAFNYWAIRKRAFTRLARTKIQQGAGSAVIKIALGLAQFGTIGLLLGNIVGQAAGLVSLLFGALREDVVALKRIRRTRIRWTARRYRDFPLYSTWSAVANTAGSQLPLLLFSALFSPTVAGLYMLGHRVLHMPMNLLGTSIGQVFHANAAEARRDNRLGVLTLKAFEALVRISFGPMVLLAVVAPQLFTFFFGQEWKMAGVYAQWMIPWLVIVFITSPISTLVSVMEKQKQGLIFQISLLVIRSSAIIIGSRLDDPILAVACYSLSSLLVWAVFNAVLMHYCGISLYQWFRLIITEVICVLPFAIALYCLSQQLPNWFSNNISSLSIVICSTLFIGGVFLWRSVPMLNLKERSLLK